MRNLTIILLAALFCTACTSVSEERIGNAEKLYWEEGANNPEIVEHYSDSHRPTWDFDQVVKIYGSVAPIYGQGGFVGIVKKRAAEWGCNAIYELRRGSQSQTSYHTSVYVGRNYASASTIPITVHVPYGTFIGIRRRGWYPPKKEE